MLASVQKRPLYQFPQPPRTKRDVQAIFDSCISDLFARGHSRPTVLDQIRWPSRDFPSSGSTVKGYQMISVDKTTKTIKWLVSFFNAIFFVSFMSLWHFYIKSLQRSKLLITARFLFKEGHTGLGEESPLERFTNGKNGWSRDIKNHENKQVRYYF